MTPETRAFLAAVRDAEDPDPGDESRVLEAVHAALASSAAATVAGTAKAAKGFGIFGISSLELGGAIVALGAAVVLASTIVPRSGAAPTASRRNARTLHDEIGVKSRVPAPSREEDLRAPLVASVPAPASARAKPLARTESPKAASLREEIALLNGVRAALDRGDGADALRRLDEHRTADRQFSAERGAARIFALCSLGRAGEARRALATFLRENPGSVQRAALERSCAAEKIDGER